MSLNFADAYLKMVKIRLLEDRLQEMCFRGEAGDLHFNKGQEAISVGVCRALEKRDHIVTHHRTIAHEIARGAETYSLVAEVLAKKTGFNGGRAGEMHMSNPAIRHDFSFQLVGTCVPVAAGIAWALKHAHKLDEVVAVFFGDAATSNGQIHEGLTIAAIHKLPLLLICENNGLAGNIRPSYYMPTKSVSERMDGYGIEAFSVDGNKVDDVEGVTRSVLADMRKNPRPMMIEMHTTRLCCHKQGQGDARPKSEIEELAERDPLKYAAKLVGRERGSKEDQLLEAEIGAELDAIFTMVAADPLPDLVTQ